MVEALVVVASFALIAGVLALAARHGHRRVAIPALLMRQSRPNVRLFRHVESAKPSEAAANHSSRDWFTDVTDPASPLNPLNPSNPASPLYPD